MVLPVLVLLVVVGIVCAARLSERGDARPAAWYPGTSTTDRPSSDSPTTGVDGGIAPRLGSRSPGRRSGERHRSEPVKRGRFPSLLVEEDEQQIDEQHHDERVDHDLHYEEAR